MRPTRTGFSPAVLTRVAEQLRQERETFNQAKEHEAHWFTLRLVMGYAAVVLIAAIMLISTYILFNESKFSPGVVTAAGAALFVDIIGLLAAVWKITLNPNFSTRLGPITQTSIAEAASALEAQKNLLPSEPPPDDEEYHTPHDTTVRMRLR